MIQKYQTLKKQSTTSDYNKFTSKIFDTNIKQKRISQ